MIAAHGKRQDASLLDAVVIGGKPHKAVVDAGRIGADIAQIGAIDQFVRPDPGMPVLGPDHGRLVADLPRPVARTRPVGGAAVPGRADQTDIDLGKLFRSRIDLRQAHEGGYARKTR